MTSKDSNSEMSRAPTGVMTVKAMPAYDDSGTVEIQYYDAKIIGNGSFGVVYKAKLLPSNEKVAIKKVLQDKRYKNRELHIMRRLQHPNIVELKYYFYSSKSSYKDDIFLNLLMECIPETVYRVMKHYTKSRENIPMIYVKLYMYQLFRALSYMHSFNICHRDIKPQNLLVDPERAILKLCDFGSAKQLVENEVNVSYICSRYYRAPELIFGATDYQCTIDLWSAGCVFAELLIGQPLFPGDSGVDQLVEIIKVIGTPTKDEIKQMNKTYTEFKFPNIRPYSWSRLFRKHNQEGLTLIPLLLKYTPTTRITALNAMAHPFFDDCRVSDGRLSNQNPYPPITNLTSQEVEMAKNSSVYDKLRPKSKVEITQDTISNMDLKRVM
ncbi:hypothetical protein SNEBB_008705 [Seison nebaliae]|nr:hypothetical protein SNEBB_008705 [Seison nebaliae]